MSQGSGSDAGVFRWSFGNVEFDESRWELTVAGVVVELEHKPLQLLAYLLRHAGEVVTKDELLENVWQDRVVVETAVTNAMVKLRRALGEMAGETIVTVPKVGYRLVATVARRAVTPLPSASSLAEGQSVPRRAHWKLAERLARHGDSEVWRAVHAKTGDVRVFKFSLDGQRLNALKREVTLARVLRESLGDREDLVRIIDWDFEEAPFFLEAEYGGTALDVWAGDARLDGMPLPARLVLMGEVAAAVAAAHGVGVLHKDLKPSNLLIWECDGQPRARVADFGSGRLVELERLEALGITRLGLTQAEAAGSNDRSGTPLYLAPEVAAGEAPSVRSDIYALGVILYQLVVGDLRRQLSPGWEADVADPLLREDITLFANVDPARRPASAQEIVERLASLDERRVRRDTEEAVRQRLADNERRLARARARRPWMIAASLLLLGGLIGMTRLYGEARHAQGIALQERNAARAMNRFLQADILGQADPFSAGRPDITMRQALDRGAAQIDRRFSLQPSLAAPMHETVARAYVQLSDYPKAAAHFTAAAQARRRSNGGAATAAELAATGLALEARARMGEAEAFPKEAEFGRLASQIDALPAPQRAVPRIHLNRARAWAAFQRLDFAAAVAPLEAALADLGRLPDVDADLEASIRQAHAMALAHSGTPTSQVIALQRQAIARHAASSSETKMPMALSARYAIARMRMIAGDERLLETEYREIIEDLTRVLGPRSESTLVARHGLAHIYFKQGRWDDCIELEERNVQLMQEALGPSHLSTVNSANTLAVCSLAGGDPKLAQSRLNAAMAALPRNDDVKSKLVRVMLQLNLAHARAALGDWAEVERLVRDVRRDGAKLITMDSDAEGEVALLEGQLLAARGGAAPARSKIEAAVALLAKKNPPDYWLILQAQRQLSAIAAS